MTNQERILVVDDEVVIRELLHEVLTEQGFGVKLAHNGPQALDILRQEDDFVVLFTDIMMPEMDGIELISKAREICPAIVPIVMTGYATLETASAAVKEGAYDYVQKPFNLDEVRRAVTYALERRRLSDENARLRDITDLFNISENIAAVRHEEQLLRFVLHAALERVGAMRGSVMLVSPDGRELNVACSEGLPAECENAVVALDGTISGWVARNVQPLFVEDIRKNPAIEEMGHQLKGRSFISVPLERKASPMDDVERVKTSQPQVVAVLNVTDKRQGGEFTETDLKALSIVANHAAAALENVRLLRDMEDSQREIVFTLGEIVETRSRETGSHVKRVAEYCRMLALKCGLTWTEGEMLRMASPLHDIGKVGIPDAILGKPGRLNEQEYEVIKTHAQIGYDMLCKSKGRILQAAAIIALEHHERWDGGGYPAGKSGEDIHIYGRIGCIADVFDALGVDRVYKEAWPVERILDYFREQRAQQFDPRLVDVFFENLDEVLAIRDKNPENATLMK